MKYRFYQIIASTLSSIGYVIATTNSKTDNLLTLSRLANNVLL